MAKDGYAVVDRGKIIIACRDSNELDTNLVKILPDNSRIAECDPFSIGILENGRSVVRATPALVEKFKTSGKIDNWKTVLKFPVVIGLIEE